jgi:hypothetical protein
VKGGISIVVVAVAISALTSPEQISAQQKVGVVETLTGSVNVTRDGAKARPLIASDGVFVRDRIVAENHSRATIQLGTDAIVVVGHGSTMTVSEESGKVVLDLDEGAAQYEILREDSRDDEPHALRTPNAIARTTGGVIVTVTRGLAMTITTTVCVLKGRGSAAVADGTSVDIPEGRCVAVEEGRLGALFDLPRPPVPVRPRHHIS